MSTIKPSLAGALLCGLTAFVAHGGGQLLSGSNLRAEFGDSATGWSAGNTDRLDRLEWVDSNGGIVSGFVANSGSACGDARIFFGQAYGEPEGTAPLAVGPGAASTAADVTGSTLRSIGSQTGSQSGCQTANDTTAQTDYRTFPGIVGKGDILRIIRSFHFSAGTPVFNGHGLRAYVPAMPLVPYGKVLVPNAAGSAVNTVDARTCGYDCEQVDWNGRWFANDDGTGRGLLVIRDPLSTAEALLNVRSDLATSTNRSSIVLLQPAGGWKAAVTEIEYLCPYDSLSWPAADRDAGRLPLGCTVDRPAYEFGSVAGAAQGSSKVSRALIVGKLAAPATIAVTGGRYSINGGAFTTGTGSVMPGDSLRLQVVAAAAASTTTRGLIDIDGKLGVYSVTTAPDAGNGRSAAKSGSSDATTAAETPTLSVGDVSITEGNSGTKNLIFTATLSPAAAVTVTVRAATVNGTATSGSDFNGGTQTLTFLAGETTKMVGIGIRGDAVSEGDEIFYVNLTSATGGAVIGRSQAVGTIINDDGVVTDTTPDAFSFTAASGVAVSSVQTSNAITVSGINAASPISVTGGSYSINGGAYTTAAGTVTVGQTVTVQQTASSSFNTLSTATLTIGGVSAPYAVTTLAADTTPDAFSFGALTGVAAGSVQTSETITVSGINTGSPISIVGGSYSVNSGDYTTASGTVLAGQTVRVQQTASTSLATTTTATLTIGGVSAPFNVTTQLPALSINDVSIAEGNSGITNMVFTVSLNGAAPTPVSVDYATADGTAQAGSDYTAGTGSLSFPAGTTSQTITVAVLGDTVVEPSETVLVNLSNPAGASLADPQGVGTIVSDDLAGPTLSISDASTTEGNSGTKALTFTATLSPAATIPVTVRATTANGTATSGSDYTGGALTLTFAPGETSKSASISIRGDTVVEPDETFFVNLTAPTGGAVIGRAQATGTIVNDDAASDTTPDPFSFTPVTDVAPNSVQTSNAITVAGINAASPISVTGGSYNINGGAYTTLAGTVTVGQSVTVRQTASASTGTTTTAMLSIGGVSAAYAVTTQAADTTPDSFSFTPTSNAALSSIQTSNAVTISGINSLSPVSITAGGSYSINDGVYTDQPGTISAGQTLKVRQTASASNGTSTTVTVTVGGVSAGYTVTTIATALDTTPDAFSFTPVTNAAPGSTQTSNPISVTGINAPAAISISGGMYSINGSLFTTADGTVFNGDTVTVQVQASSVGGESRVANLAIGDVTGAFTVTAAGSDSSPDPFSFRSANKAQLGSVQFSGPTLITGYNVPTPISIVGGSYRINAPPPVDGVHEDSGYTTEPGMLMPGDTVGVRALASDQPNTLTVATVTIGNVPGTFTVTTEAADSTPRPFSFASRYNVEPGRTQVSDAVVVMRINIPTPISVLGGSYSINGGEFTSAAGQVRAGDSVRVAVIASTAYSTSSAATLTISDASASFTVVTVAADSQPDPFAFGVVSGVAPGSLQSSQPVMLTGVTVQSPISIVGGSYSINGGDFRSDAGTVNPGDAIVVRLTAAPDFGTSRTATLTVASRSGAFTAITRSADTVPDPFSFTPVVNAVAGAVQVSNAIVVSGIEAPATISLSGDTSSGAYRINGGAYTIIPGTVRSGDIVDLRLRAPATAATGTSASLSIGGISAAFTVATSSSALGTTPDPFVFAAVDSVLPSSLQVSNPITISGVAAAVTISVSGDASAQYSVNGGAFTSAKGTAVSGDVIRLRLQASASSSTTVSAKFSAGATRASFFVATLTPDTAPDAFVFNSLAGVVRGSIQTSNAVTISGINTPAAISIGGGFYSINGAPFTNMAGLVSNGATVVVQVVAATGADAQTQATLMVGSLSASFSVSTEAADAMPDPLVLFGPAATFPVLAQTSNTMVVSGINTAVPVSVSGGSYSRNGAPFTSAAGMVNNGDTLAVQVMAPAIVGRTATVTIVVGAGVSSVSAAYSVTAEAAVDPVPDPFEFTALTGVPVQSEQVSAAITIFGNSSASPISIVGGTYSINGGPFIAESSSILAGDQVSVRVSASQNLGIRVTATLTIGGVSAPFSVTTVVNPANRPAPFVLSRMSSPDDPVQLSYSLPGTLVTSNTVTLSNIVTPVPISITGGSYSIDGGPYTAAAGTVGNGARVTVQMVMAPTFNTTTTVRLAVGNVSSAFSARTTSSALGTTPVQLSGAESYVYRPSNLPEVPLRAFVFKPVGWKADVKRPAYLFFFGGGWVTGMPSTSRMSFATGLGMVGIAVDYRTNQRFGTTPLDAVADARAALRWVQDHADEFGIDPARIVVAGSSAGGHLSLWTAIGATPVGSETASAPLAPPAALVMSSPVSDTSPALGYQPARFGMNAEALSPISHLDQRMPPMIIHHGNFDVTVEQSRSVALCNAFLAGNNVCEFHNVAGASHAFSDVPESFAVNDNQVTEFLLQQGILPALKP